MKALLVILIFFALAEPAAACRHFSIWHYNFPQPCLIDRPEAQAAPAPAAPDIPLPDLTQSIWRSATGVSFVGTTVGTIQAEHGVGTSVGTSR